MVFISRLRLRNFKSFKAADITLPKTFICFAGPNGSGKSNLCDAIRFVMGEKSLRALRAKKVRDLIHMGSKTAEVTLNFEDENGGEGYQIKRAIREDGKIRYRLNDKKTTRGAILETLKRHNLDESGRNTIAQGEVQRIINMNGKERRGIIDSVAGIADFEAKKKEATSELGTVEERIKEARLVLGERKAYLDDLGREKETAIKYTKSKKTLTNAKGTLLKMELDRLDKDLEGALSGESKLKASLSEKEKEMAKLEGEVAAVDGKRAKTSEEMQSKQKTHAFVRRLEELKASCGSKKQLIEDKEGFIKSVKGEREALERESHEAKGAIDALEKEVASLKLELKVAEDNLALLGGSAEDDKVATVRKQLEAQGKEIATIKERLAFLAAEIASKGELIGAKAAESKSLLGGSDDEDDDGGGGSKDSDNKGSTARTKNEDIPALRRDVERIAKEIDRSFNKTKDINAQMNKLDQEMLELKEKSAVFRVRASPQLANPALSFISELMKSKSGGAADARGIYGMVADLITFDGEYASAVEAAAGARLMYVVVDSVDTATSVIEKLKKAKAGRATFIPLDSIRTQAKVKSGKFSSILDVITCKSDVLRAVEYVFAETLLVDSVDDAKKLGVGNNRMVTRDGEIFERSGIVSGGRTQSGLFGANQLRKIEDELNDVKSTKESLMQELYSIREEESKLRAEKSQLELQIKTVEMQQRMEQDRRKENEQAYKRKDQLADEIDNLKQSIKEREQERTALGSTLAEKEHEATKLTTQLHAAEEEFRKETAKSSQKKADMSAAVSSLRAKIEGKHSEMELRKNEDKARSDRLKKLSKDEKEAHEKIIEVKKQIHENEAELVQTEAKISSISKDIESLFEQMKSYEEELQALGKKRGHVKIELDKLSKDMNQVEIKKATTSTRLEDIRAEYASYAEAEHIHGTKEELAKMVNEAESALNGLGNVNMAAIEMYDKKKAEIDEVENKIGKLDTEREAILSMISEIDEHKKEAFFETFNAVSDHFVKLFKYVNVGQGHLSLSEQADPFDSGLFIKLRRNNQEHALDALSGGEKTLVALIFIFALQMFKPAPFYILDEVDAALDKPNSKNLADLVAKMAKDSQFIVVSHNDTVMSNSESVIGVTKMDGTSKLVGIKIKQAATVQA